MSNFFFSFIFYFGVSNSYISTLYTSLDWSYLSSIISQSEDVTSGLYEKSLTTTFYATHALSSLNINNEAISNDKLCVTLKGYKISSWEEFHNLLLSRSRIKNCLDSIKDTSQKKLTDGLSAHKLSKIYYSVNGIYTLTKTNINLYDTSKISVINILKHIKTFQLNNKLFTEQIKSSKSKSSIHKTSMALYAIAKLLSLPNLTKEQEREIKESLEIKGLLNSFIETANVLVKDYSKLNQNMISYSNSLTATSVVLESINEFLLSLLSINQFKDLNDLNQKFNKFNDNKYVENIIRYILTFRATTSPTSARHVIILMNMIKQSILFEKTRPISVIITNNIYSYSESQLSHNKPLTISITDVYDNQILASNNNTSIVIESCSSNSQSNGPIGSFNKHMTQQNKYTFDSFISFKDHGIYLLKIKLTDDNISQDIIIETQVKVTTFISKAIFGIQYSKKSTADDGYNRITYPGRIKQIYDVSPSQKVKIEIQIKSVVKPNQIIIDFHRYGNDINDINDINDSVLQIVPKTRQDKYGITIDLNKQQFSGILSEGKYSLSIIIGDALIGDPLIWNEIVVINCIQEEDEAEIDYEPINDEIPKWIPKKNISHTFSNKENEPIILFPFVFCIIVSIPLLYFIYYVFIQIGSSITFERDVQVSSLLFIITLSAIVTILFLYWWQWNIFEAGGWLAIACIPAFFFGYNVLKNHLEINNKNKKKQH